MKKKISILGSTGSIGLNTLKIIEKNKKLFEINILAANKNYKLICKQIKKFNPKIFIINDVEVCDKVKKRFKNKKIILINNITSHLKLIKKSDITIAAIPGIRGLEPTIEMTKKSKKILIANKESIICGWRLIKNVSIKYRTKIVPIDSEHFSIMKILENHSLTEIKKIYLTASGGPFLKHKISKLNTVKPHQAIKHPKWKMGKKISIDSATLMNKMLETIEAEKLFSITQKNIEIIIHPESLVHAIIEFKNGLIKFIYHETTMLIPLGNAILEKNFQAKDYFEIKNKRKKSSVLQDLKFSKVDKKRFPLVKLKKRLNEYNSSVIIINAVNEILVDLFLGKKIAFTSFYNYFLRVLNDRNYRKYAIKIPKNISQIFEIDQWAKDTIYRKIRTNKNA